MWRDLDMHDKQKYFHVHRVENYCQSRMVEVLAHDSTSAKTERSFSIVGQRSVDTSKLVFKFS